MIRRTLLTIVLTVLLSVTIAPAQSRNAAVFRKNYAAPDELISLTKNMSFDQVFSVFYDLSKKYTGKIIISDVPLKFQIGLDIDRMHWMDALEAILREHDLWYEEHEDFLQIVRLKEDEPKKTPKPGEISFESREVAISAIFFEADGSKLRQLGFSWNFGRGKDVNLNVTQSAADGKASYLDIDVQPNLDYGSLLALFKTLESDQVGEVIANPQITVRSGVPGRIQVGNDFSITTRDFAGNAINQFFSTGSIIEVTPQVLDADSVQFIHLDLKIERSSGNRTSEGGAEIQKSEAKTSVLMLDGEESVIGGLYVNEETSTRSGIPYLKDLPWWFFGLRYVFGFDSKKLVKKELMIVIKAELVATLAERLHNIKAGVKNRLLRDTRRENSLKMQYYEEQLKQ